MKAIENSRINGIVERRPSASAMPIGIEATMPITETTRVTSMPPQSRVSTIGSPPRSRPMMAMTRAMPAKVAAVATTLRSALLPPPMTNTSAVTTMAVKARSVQTG